MWNQKPSFRFEIDNFSEKKAAISSKTFVSGGCEWYVHIYPKGFSPYEGHLSLFLCVENSTTLRTGWKRMVGASSLFCASNPAWGLNRTLPVSKFQEKGFLENDRLIIEVYIKVIEAFDGEGGDVSNNKKKTVDINGSQVFASQLDEVTSGRKIWGVDNKYRAQQVEERERVTNLERMEVDSKLDSLNTKLDDGSLKRKKTDDTNESRAQQVEKRVKNPAVAELRLNEMLIGFDSRIKQIEENVTGLGLKLESLVTKLEEISQEKKKADDADGSRVQQLEESVKNIELMFSHLKVEVDNKKNKSCADDGFLLVD
ncbi:hypothetical protein Bca101_041004 [Brassica carinata]